MRTWLCAVALVGCGGVAAVADDDGPADSSPAAHDAAVEVSADVVMVDATDGAAASDSAPDAGIECTFGDASAYACTRELPYTVILDDGGFASCLSFPCSPGEACMLGGAIGVCR
jgi:hypothetical protein